jgi:bifunctional UDP-N-acetylglucosamine pyrophosphorylase/glucosamine-1-phosphate N-acetyltransferase
MKSDLPKVLHTLGGESLLGHVIKVAHRLDAAQTIVVYGHGGEQVRQALADYDVQWVEQDRQLGTGHAVEQALPLIPQNHTVLLLYGDVPLIGEQTLQRLLAAGESGALALLTAELDEPTGYGRIVRDPQGRVQRIVEQKDASSAERVIREINTGMLAATVEHLHDWIGRLDNDNAQGEFYLTDIVGFAVADGVAVATTQPESRLEIEGINDKRQLAELERAWQARQAQQYLLDGLTLRDPARFDVRGELHFGRDVEIDINVLIEGRVELGDRVRIGPHCVLKDCVVGADTRIHANSVIEDSWLGTQCDIGPFARLRPATELAERVKVGNFVEIKKSTVASDSKINHLSYVGDASVGARVNIGAGTITCNYDGANKHRTVIGDDVFIGSDTQLVAPVHIGDGATIGAGSTITRDAPTAALTLSRNEQCSRPDWKRPVKKV